jgi:hypothetical protein
MGREVQEAWAHIDELLWDIRNRLRLLERIIPQNVHVERDTFLQHWQNDTVYNPSFSYNLSGFDAAAVDDMLSRCETAVTELVPRSHESTLLPLYEQTLDDLRSAQQIVTQLGDSDTVQEHAAVIYGTHPNSDEVTTAEHILDTIRERERHGEQRSSDLHDACTTLLEQLGLDDWGVTYTDAPNASVSAAEKVVKVPNPLQGRTYQAGEPYIIAAHEISHGIRAANGYNQIYNLFATGLNGYYATDEGLAILLEFAYGKNHPHVLHSELRKYALRTIAADAAATGNTFWETFTTLMDYTSDPDRAWHVTLRAYRGGDGTDGGVIKDHIYQRGMTRVTNRLLHSDTPEQTLRTLYLGKYSINDQPTVQQLHDGDVLSAPQYTPFPILDESTILSMAERIADQDLGMLRQAT